ncbi:MAG: roadblock/LC7 domain-containing protein [Deltaproteobacteria bacterium]|nr:roadblock/LC7 domain-containing protein [Candidatus Zymogenaceae bacterium]
MFQETLQELVNRVPEANGAILVDTNGEEIVSFAEENEYEMKLLGAHLVPIHHRLEAISGRINTGLHEEIIIRTDSAYIISAPLENQLYIVLRLSPSPTITPTVSQLKKAISSIIEESS